MRGTVEASFPGPGFRNPPQDARMDRQEQAEQLFGVALELERNQRAAFLDRVCAGKPALRRMVEDLLDENDQLSGFLSEPAFARVQAVGMTSQTVVLAPGNRLLDRYAIIGNLGAGGMGVIYRARDEKLDREVAIKMLQPGVLEGDEARARFRREARALAKLNHAHIAAVYDVIEKDGADCIVMELVEGRSLAAKLGGGALSVKEATTIALQIAEALEEAHEQGVIHRDLKPANVMINPKGQAKVLDFGLARLLGPADVTQTARETGGVMGTPLYMSPEQAIGQKADVRSDLWSLGVTYYELLTGVAPFRRTTTLAILRAITDEAPQPVRELSPQTPALAEQIVARALEKDPDLRYQHARDFATDLRRVLRDLEPGRASAPGMRTEPVSRTTVGVRPFRRMSLRWIGFVAAALLLAAAMLILLTPAPLTGTLNSTQISFSNETKLGPLLTDGARLYFESHNVPSAMSVSGGMIVPIPGMRNGMYLVDVSADGSKVLLWAQSLNNEALGGSFLAGSTLGGAWRNVGTEREANPIARWSWDGKSIYFVKDQQVWAMDENGGHLQALWKPPQPPVALAVSPDGNQLSVTIMSDPWRIWLVGSDGKQPHPLELNWPPDAGEAQGQWTPNGRHFVFNSDREARHNVYELVKPRWFEFWKKPEAMRLTGNQLNITDTAPARDSQGLFVLGRVESGAMQVFDPRAGKLVPFLGGLPALQLVVSPDRQWMVYTEYPSGHLWKSRIDGSEAVQLTNEQAWMEQWSPDGKWIAYSDWRKIYRVSADGGAPEKVMPEGDNEVMPTWSPDGKSIVFNRFDTWHEPDGLYTVDLGSRKATPLPGAEKYYIPAWSPDGKYLVAMAREPLRMVIYSAATKQWRTLRQFDSPEGFYAWSPDSRTIYYSQPQTNIGMYRLSVPDGRFERVSDIPNTSAINEAFVSVTADGQPAIMSNAGAEQVYLLQWK
jgi:serine/threonine protein kinase/Tol biopolymer transport system component